MRPELSIIFALCLFQALFASIGTLIRTKIRNRYDLVDWFVLGAIGYNGIICPIIVLDLSTRLRGQSASFQPSAVKLLTTNAEIWLYPICSIVAVISVWMGSALVKKVNHIDYLSQKIQGKSNLEKRYFLISTAFLTAGILSYWIYVYPYGGFVKYLDVSLAIRSGLSAEVNVEHGLTFLKRFGGFAFFASILFAGLIVRRKIYASPIQLWLAFLVSVVFSIYVLFSWRGRLGLLLYIAIFPLGYYFFRKGLGYKSFFRIAIVLLVVVMAAPSVDMIWGKGDSRGPLAKFIVKELSFPLAVFRKAHEAEQPRWMKDIILSPVYILPTRVWSDLLKIDTVSSISTKRVLGVRKGERGSTTGIPVDFVSLGIMEGGPIGVFVLGILFGVLLSKVDKWVLFHFPSGIREMMYGYLVLFLSIQSFIYCDPQHIIVRNFHFIVGFMVLVIFGRRKKSLSDIR